MSSARILTNSESRSCIFTSKGRAVVILQGPNVFFLLKILSVILICIRSFIRVIELVLVFVLFSHFSPCLGPYIHFLKGGLKVQKRIFFFGYMCV